MMMQRPLIIDSAQNSYYFTKLNNWSLRSAINFLQVARRLYTSKEDETQGLGPLATQILEEGKNQLMFTEEDLKNIEENKESFPVVAGVRRQIACYLLKLMEAIGLCSNFDVPKDAKTNIKQLCSHFTQLLLKEGEHLNDKIAFKERHSEMLAYKLEESSDSDDMVDKAIVFFGRIYESHKDCEDGKQFPERDSHAQAGLGAAANQALKQTQAGAKVDERGPATPAAMT